MSNLANRSVPIPYPPVLLHVAGRWREAGDGRTISVLDPTTEQPIGTVAHASRTDLDEALLATATGFAAWRATSAFERSKLIRRAAALLRERSELIARLMTAEQGKPLAQSRTEVLAAADIAEWMAEEARRAYGRLVPARAPGVTQMVVPEPVGPVAAFTPWNFPVNQVVRKLGSALAAGCSIIVKAPEETPASPAELVRCFVDAGLPAGAVQLVFGDPAAISEHLIAHPAIRKVTFTGSTAVGKQLAALAGRHMKRVTMELGGHAPVIVCADADLAAAARQMAAAKFRNAGQVCVAPTRFLVEAAVHDEFVERLVAEARAVRIGDGMAEGVTMGPLANARRVPALEALIADAVRRGAEVRSGGGRLGNRGYFFEPTVVTGVDATMRMMNEEPFGPLAMVRPFRELGEAIKEANRLSYGLAAFGYARSAAEAQRIADEVEAGMVSINHYGLGLPEVPFGGIKDSGYGSEGGAEAIQAYLNPKFVSRATG